MSGWSPHPRHPRHGRLQRKAVPDGSYDFQKVLDEILTSEEWGDEKDEDVARQEDECIYRYDDDFEEDDDDRHHNNSYTITISECSNHNHNDNNNNHINNNNDNGSCSYRCELGQCQGRVRSRSDGSRDAVSPSGITIVDCFGDSLSYSLPDTNVSTERSLRLPHISQHRRWSMGTNCSTNNPDHRDFHNVGGGTCLDDVKHGKRGRPPKKRCDSDPPANVKSVPSLVCTCKSRGPEEELIIPLSNSTTSGQKRTTLSPNSATDACSGTLSNSRLSPNVDSSGHIKLSRVAGSSKARTTSTCDVSPHRLLTRRNHSPGGRTTSFDNHFSNGASTDMRPRSQSWSVGKLGSRPVSRSLTSSSILSPVAHHKAISPNLTAPSNGPRPLPSRPASTTTSTVSVTSSIVPKTECVHEPDCPLYVRPDEMPKLPGAKSSTATLLAPPAADGDDADDLAPMSRRRAASESQTSRPRRLLPRTPDCLEHASTHEHAHVHWADEEKGSSLSTSVFLTSIRPRSYSHGAMDLVPHRPILKKVTGF